MLMMHACKWLHQFRQQIFVNMEICLIACNMSGAIVWMANATTHTQWRMINNAKLFHFSFCYICMLGTRACHCIGIRVLTNALVDNCEWCSEYMHRNISRCEYRYNFERMTGVAGVLFTRCIVPHFQRVKWILMLDAWNCLQTIQHRRMQKWHLSV